MNKSNPNIEPLDFWDFMTNDDNPILKRLSDKLLSDSEFTKILADNGYVEPASGDKELGVVRKDYIFVNSSELPETV